jgi:hypothetical protein
MTDEDSADSPTLEELVTDLRAVIGTGVTAARLRDRKHLLRLESVRRCAGSNASKATMLNCLARILTEVVESLEHRDRDVNKYLLGTPPHQDDPASRRRVRAAEAAGLSQDYFRKGPTREALEAVAIQLSRREDEKVREPRAQRDSAQLSNIPKPIAEYLMQFPEFAVPHDLAAQQVRTSRESFMSAARCIARSLKPGDRIIGTDNLNFDRTYITYWVTEGLEYLRTNYEAAQRGVDITRIFVVTKNEREQHEGVLYKLGRLQRLAGVTPKLVIYETLPPNCLYEFAIFGDMYVDEVVYDIRSNVVVDNYIHWSSHKLATFQERERLTTSYVDQTWSVRGKSARALMRS